MSIPFPMRRRLFAYVASIIAATLLLTGCPAGGRGGASVSTPPTGGTKVAGGTATYAGTVGNPNYIFPLVSAQYLSNANISEFINLMYPSLYTFEPGKLSFDYAHSIAAAPQYSTDRKTVTVHLHDWNWSDGRPLTARDIVFSVNLIRANKFDYAGYNAPYFPDNLASVTTPDAHTVVLHLTGPVGPTWFTANQLNLLTPLPQHVWDKIGSGSPVSDYDQTSTGAKQVWKYLTGEASNTSTYATNPLWQVVSGAWKLAAFSPDGHITFHANKGYSGSPKPTLDTFVEVPFTSTTAQLNALRSGSGPDVGGLSYSQISQVRAVTANGYYMDPWPTFGVNYIAIDFANPTTGPIVTQLYFRQALQGAVDQKGVLAAGYKNQGFEQYGPIPSAPDNSFYSPSAQAAQPGYSIDTAKRLLSSHGWTVRPNGVSTCDHPGTGAGQCGTGVAAGSRAELTLLSSAQADTASAVGIQSFQSEASKAGIKIDVTTAPFNSVYGTTTACAAERSKCSWQLSFFDGWGYGPQVPTGEFLFRTGGTANFGRYSDPVNDANIAATVKGAAPDALAKYQTYLAGQLPVIYQPGGYFQFTLVKNTLRGVTPQNPTLTITPERWYFVK